MILKVAPRIGWSILVLLVAGCGRVTAPAADPVVEPTPVQAASSPVDSRRDLPLDAVSRDLLAVLDPTESARVTVGTTWADELSRAALDAGMHAQIVDSKGAIAIDGPLDRVLSLVDGVPVTSVTIQESMEAMRPIPADRPVVDVPNPGHPYVLTGFTGDLSKVTIPSPQREAMLESLVRTVQSIDGRPYAQLQIEGGCGNDKTGPSCGLTAVGFTSASVGREDDWSLRATARTEPGGAIEGMLTTSVPRPLVRAAEWSARHDDAALARIRTFASCCNVSWDPARPGQITLVYDRRCVTTFMPGRDLADTGQCSDELSITVDLRSGAVVSIEPPAG